MDADQKVMAVAVAGVALGGVSAVFYIFGDNRSSIISASIGAVLGLVTIWMCDRAHIV